MKSIKFTAYRDLVINDILNYNISQLQDRYSHDIKFLYSVLNDLSKGPVSPNYKYIKRIAFIGKFPVDALINRANVLIDDIGIENTKNYYEILSVEKDASGELIRDSWLSQLKENHPDLIGEQGS